MPGPVSSTVASARPSRASGDGYHAAFRGVAHGVVEEGRQDLSRPLGVAANREEVRNVGRGEAPSLKRRPVRLTEKGWEAVGKVPLLGRTAAGRGLEAVPTEGESYSLLAEMLSTRGGKRRYLPRSVGDSMIGARIEDDDMLLVEEDEEPPDGEVVVALLRGGEEATVRRIYREGETVRIKPRNGDHEDIVLPAEEVYVQGRVILVVHPPLK
ncbi:MAG: hypothetical protein M3Q60_07880 [Actinomycetota bacterium]|nr:hypothetical protein [Actinomycetota bacterium]